MVRSRNLKSVKSKKNGKSFDSLPSSDEILREALGDLEPNHKIIERSFTEILQEIEPNFEKSEDLRDTPVRFAKSIVSLTTKNEDILNLKSFPNPGCDQIIVLKGIKFYTLCAHHVLPFFGTVNIGYIPNKRIFGLSKFPRIVKYFSKSLQIQEKFTQEIANFVQKNLDCKGVIVNVNARHLCMEMRGIESCSETETCAITKCFRTDASAKAEALDMFKG